MRRKVDFTVFFQYSVGAFTYTLFKTMEMGYESFGRECGSQSIGLVSGFKAVHHNSDW